MVTSSLINYNNYYLYANDIQNQKNVIKVYVPTINVDNIDDHISAIHSILLDGIELDYIHNLKFRISFSNGSACNLGIFDYYYNLIMWGMVLRCGSIIEPRMIFFPKNGEIHKKDIAEYVNTFILNIDNKKYIGNSKLNEIIADGMYYFGSIEDFSEYFAITINNEDTINLTKADGVGDRVYDILHYDFNSVPFADVKDVGLQLTDEFIQYIKDSSKYMEVEHGLANSFRASEGVNPRQFKEALVNIGTKSAIGTVYPTIINTSYANGGVMDMLSYIIESKGARYAQVLSKKHVGESGDFARISGNRNIDTFLNPDPNVDCGTRNLIRYEVKDKKHLYCIRGRYYRMVENGIERVIVPERDEFLIGSTIWLRSPMTCYTHAKGMGICQKCYGELYFTNGNINIGKYAAAVLSSKLTQRQLSAKHLLETVINKLVWIPQELFEKIFNEDIDTISFVDDLEDVIGSLKRAYFVVSQSEISLSSNEESSISIENDDGNIEEDTYNEYITSFRLILADGSDIYFTTENKENLYITSDFMSKINKRIMTMSEEDDDVKIPIYQLLQIPLFRFRINNDEISKAMVDITNHINTISVVSQFDIHTWIESLNDIVLSSGLGVDMIHLEVILSNQIRDKDNILSKPNWKIPGVKYELQTLDRALKSSNSIIQALTYENIALTLKNPLSYQMTAPSTLDLFYVKKPQEYMDETMYDKDAGLNKLDKGIKMCDIVAPEFNCLDNEGEEGE